MRKNDYALSVVDRTARLRQTMVVLSQELEDIERDAARSREIQEQNRHTGELMLTACGTALVVVLVLPMLQQIGMILAVAGVVFLITKYVKR